MSDAPCVTELEQQRLFSLNRLADLAPNQCLDDGECLYCGIRPRTKNLCVVCEERRQRLSEKYPGVASPVRAAQDKIASGFTKLGNVTPPRFRQPHNSE